jgi:hypothetical protein
LKTKTYGRAYISFHRPASLLTARGLSEQAPPNVESVLIQALLPIKALQDYRRGRADDISETQILKFSSAGFDTLKVRAATNKSGTFLGKKYWPDSLGCYWWSLTSNEGTKIESFYWTKDLARGWPDKKNKDCYWFIIHDASTGTEIDGFCYQADKKRGFPDKDGNYQYFVEYSGRQLDHLEESQPKKEGDKKDEKDKIVQTVFFQPNLFCQPKAVYAESLVKRRLLPRVDKNSVKEPSTNQNSDFFQQNATSKMSNSASIATDLESPDAACSLKESSAIKFKQGVRQY